MIFKGCSGFRQARTHKLHHFSDLRPMSIANKPCLQVSQVGRRRGKTNWDNEWMTWRLHLLLLISHNVECAIKSDLFPSGFKLTRSVQPFPSSRNLTGAKLIPQKICLRATKMICEETSSASIRAHVSLGREWTFNFIEQTIIIDFFSHSLIAIKWCSVD